MKTIAVTGVNGFVGHHLVRQIVNEGHSVIGIGQDPVASDDISGLIKNYYRADLSSVWPDIGYVDGVVHLAGLAAVGPSFDDPQKYINLNSAMVTHMCEYYLAHKLSPRLLVVSSGAIYDPNQSMPLDESASIGFSSPYAISKVLVENQCAYYRDRGLDCVIARPFNHIGPGQAQGFILPDFYDRLSTLGSVTASIPVGNIETRRDYTDVRDIVRAYATLVSAPELSHDLYNICSGNSLSGREIIDRLKKAMDMPDVSFNVDPALVRPTDISEIIGSSARLKEELGWMPETSIDQTIRDFVESKRA